MPPVSPELVADWPLIGRDAVIARFRALVDAAAGSGLALVGAAGVGKTRAATACLEIAQVAGWRTARVMGSRAASGIPFGATACLLATVESDGDRDVGYPIHGDRRAGTIRRALDALLGPTTDTRPPLCLMVDDAHLLDDGSLTLIHHLASSSRAVLIVTARSDRPLPPGVVTMWRDGVLARIDLDGLTRVDHDALVTVALGGTTDSTTSDRLYAATAGNPMLIRELLIAADDDNALFGDAHGPRRLGRLPRAASRLVDLVDERIGALDADERRCLETIAVGEPLGLDIVAAMGLADAATRLERRRLLAATVSGHRTELMVSHPLYAEVARSRLPPLRSRNLHRRLADALEATGGRRREDVLRICTWRLEAGSSGTPAQMLVAADQALVAGDLALAQRIVETAAAGSSDRLRLELVLAEALIRADRGSEAESLLANGDPDAREADESVRVEWTCLRARNLAWSLGRRAAALALVDTADIHDRDGAAGSLSSLRALIEWLDPDGHEPDRRRSDVDGAVDERAARTSTSAGHPSTVLDLLGRGQLGEAIACDRATRSGSAAGGIEAFALATSGHLARGATLALEVLADESSAALGTHAFAALAHACVALEDGDGRAALVALDSGGPSLRGSRHRWLLPLATAWRARALVLLGQLDEAREVLTFDPVVGRRLASAETCRAVAVLHAATGDRAMAVEMLRVQVTRSAEDDRPMDVGRCLHDLVLLGAATEAERARLVEVTAHMDVPLAPRWARHANGVGNGVALGDLSIDLDDAGHRVWAFEVACAAAGCLDAIGANRPAASQRRTATRLLASFPKAITLSSTTAERPGGTDVVLRPGERQVADLAAGGRSDREIAAALDLSVRTVGNYLQRSYRRLGIRTRDELPAALADLASGHDEATRADTAAAARDVRPVTPRQGR